MEANRSRDASNHGTLFVLADREASESSCDAIKRIVDEVDVSRLEQESIHRGLSIFGRYMDPKSIPREASGDLSYTEVGAIMALMAIDRWAHSPNVSAVDIAPLLPNCLYWAAHHWMNAVLTNPDNTRGMLSLHSILRLINLFAKDELGHRLRYPLALELALAIWLEEGRRPALEAAVRRVPRGLTRPQWGFGGIFNGVMHAGRTTPINPDESRAVSQMKSTILAADELIVIAAMRHIQGHGRLEAFHVADTATILFTLSASDDFAQSRALFAQVPALVNVLRWFVELPSPSTLLSRAQDREVSWETLQSGVSGCISFLCQLLLVPETSYRLPGALSMDVLNAEGKQVATKVFNVLFTGLQPRMFLYDVYVAVKADISTWSQEDRPQEMVKRLQRWASAYEDTQAMPRSCGNLNCQKRGGEIRLRCHSCHVHFCSKECYAVTWRRSDERGHRRTCKPRSARREGNLPLTSDRSLLFARKVVETELRLQRGAAERAFRATALPLASLVLELCFYDGEDKTMPMFAVCHLNDAVERGPVVQFWDDQVLQRTETTLLVRVLFPLMSVAKESPEVVYCTVPRPDWWV